MRTLLFLAVLAGFATLGYVYAPKLIEDNYRPSDDTSSVSTTNESGVALASPTPIQSTVKEITRQAPEPQARPEPKAKTKKAKAKKAKHSASVQSSDEPLDRVDSKEVERVTGLRPLNGEVKNAEEVAVQRPVVPSKQEALKSRWIDDLSGAKVRFSKKNTNDACAQEYSNCERPDAPKDISVAGVVVKTERLVKRPKEPLDGRIQQGHYIDHTPAVFVE